MADPLPLEPPAPRPHTLARVGQALAALAAAFLLAAFHGIGQQFYDGYRVPQGYGMESLLPSELVHYVMFAVLGGGAALLLTIALLGTSFPSSARAAFRALAARPRAVAAGTAGALVLGCLLISVEFLGDGILTDDEHVYRFIAQTLRTGSLTAPSPGSDLDFYWEQFVVLTDKVRYGKYPIGFPLLLAAGQALGAERAVVPLLTGLLALLMGWVGLAAFPPRVVVLALLLFALSPQVLLTGGTTLLSQPLSAVCLLAALGCLLEGDRRPSRAAAWAAGAGALFAYGIVTRPLPHVLFAGVAFLGLWAGPHIGLRRRPGAKEWLAFLLPLALGPAALLWINFRQSGNPFHTGYHAIHAENGWGPALVLYGTLGTWTMSIVSHAVRLNFWLFGWPLSLALCGLARRSAFTLLSWGMVGAELVYRVLSPKAGVGHAGPLYVYEIVPLLCLLSADGLFALLARGHASLRAAAERRRETAAAALLALTAVGFVLFLPFKLADVSRAAYGQQQVYRELRRKDVRHAVVFHRTIVPYWLGLSWAYFPPPNPPAMDGDVLFALIPNGADGLDRAVDLWKRRYPDRTAWVFGWDKEKGPFLVPLMAFLTTEDATAISGGPGR